LQAGAIAGYSWSMERPSPGPLEPAYRRHRRRRILRAALLTVASGGVLLLACLRVVHTVSRLASSRTRPAAVLLVPGHRLDRCEVDPAYARRLQRAFELWTADPGRALLISGSATGRGPSEAHAGLAYLCDLGLPPQASVLLETDARDTEENLLRAADLLRRAASDGRLAATEPVTIVSNRWHLARCAWLAERHQLPWRICAAESRPAHGLWPALALLREAASLLSLAGYDALRIDPRRLLRPCR
jgi:uncharacterized SAM-binding protein YcdF (DUF218 family)